MADDLFQKVLDAEIAYMECRLKYIGDGEEVVYAHCEELGKKFDELHHEWEQRQEESDESNLR